MDIIFLPVILLFCLSLISIVFIIFRVRSGKGGWINSSHPIYKTNELLEKIENSNNNSDIPSQIHKLAELNRDGVLTDDEFQSKKAELLKKL